MKSADASARIAEHLGKALAGALSGMTGKEFSVIAEPAGEIATLDEAIVWQQALSCSSEPALWLAAGKDAWSSAGQLILGEGGAEPPPEADCRSTWLEILGQTMGGLATALTTDLVQEIGAAKGEEITGEREDQAWMSLVARSGTDSGEAAGEGTVWRLKAAWSKELMAMYDRLTPDARHAAAKDNTLSKTFDLLLDVALPVNVSFGKTYLQIREVLKLNTGSIVELNRFVAEPVEVIVNDCVIARGEVVVVDGNYGVRITQLSSREDRLRFGMAETTPRTGVPVR